VTLSQHGDDGRRLCDRSVHNAVLPLRACLRHAAAVRVVVGDVRARSCCRVDGAGARGAQGAALRAATFD
jgi:hypothetical protein